MKLLVDRLTDTPMSHRFSADRVWLSERGLVAGPAERVDEPVEIRVDVHRMGADLFLEGEAAGVLCLTCGRCLESYRQPLRERFRLVLEPAGHRVPADPEGAAALERDGLFLSDELEAGWFRGSEIDLGAFVRELVALGAPVQPVCRQECRGLCPRCGLDRNTESCDCAELTPASPFAALSALRDQMSGGKNR